MKLFDRISELLCENICPYVTRVAPEDQFSMLSCCEKIFLFVFVSQNVLPGCKGSHLLDNINHIRWSVLSIFTEIRAII